jgi:UDP-galactopyranose mutase
MKTDKSKQILCCLKMSEKIRSEKKQREDKNKIIKDCFKQENQEKAHCKEIFANMKVQKEKLEDIFKDYTWRMWI